MYDKQQNICDKQQGMDNQLQDIRAKTQDIDKKVMVNLIPSPFTSIV